MAVNTVLVDFSIDPALVKGEKQINNYLSKIENILRDFLPNMKLINSTVLDETSFKIYTAELGALITNRIFSNGLITITIEYFKGEHQEPLLSFERSKELDAAVNEAVTGIKRSQALPPIKRGTFCRYFPSSDERLLEYDIDHVVFEERSPYQKVQIVHSKSLGNMLVLDELQNLSEADLIYTETLMQRGKENYKDKDIIILGGGDGALLYELLKEEPANVIMLEIDEVVMRACNKYMNSICGDVLEKRSGSNYDIIVGDCMKTIDAYIEEGRKFDYIFGDLTDIPISETPTGEIWSFIMKILEKSFRVLKPNGKFMTHGNGVGCPESLCMYEKQLAKLNPPVEFTRCSAFVPSFLEDWVFYQIKMALNP